MKAWPLVDQGCRLGNYESKSALCRAAALAVRGWSDTHLISFDEIAEFCDAGYLEAALALCFAAHHPIPVVDTGFPVLMFSKDYVRPPYVQLVVRTTAAG
jgi:hypothetical protein